MCLQANLQLFQAYRALFDIFFSQSFEKKLVFFKLNDRQKKFTILQSRKKAFTQAKRIGN